MLEGISAGLTVILRVLGIINRIHLKPALITHSVHFLASRMDNAGSDGASSPGKSRT